MKYITVTADDLNSLREGMRILEPLDAGYYENRELFFYGLTTNSALLDSVRESVAYWSEEEIDETDVKVAEAVLIIKLSADILYYITGSGLRIGNNDAEVVYSTGAEGPRTVNVHARNMNVAIGQFSQMALSRDSYTGEDFLLQYGSNAAQEPAAVPEQVERTEPAEQQGQNPVTPAAPASGREGVAPPAKKSSVNFDVEDWLR